MSALISSHPEHPDPTEYSDIAATVTCTDRWQVYHRLQELDIPCSCGGFEPLKVQVATPTEAVQLWSVLKRVSLPRQALVANLQQCWRLSMS